MQALKTGFLHSLIHFFFPSQCLVCSSKLTDSAPVCADCIKAFPLIQENVCEMCSIPSAVNQCPTCSSAPQPYSQLRALSFYQGPIIDLVHAMKFQKRWSVAGIFSDLLIQKIQKSYFEVDALIPIPLHPQRMKKRGFNQSTLILKKISRHFQIPVIESALKRKKNTIPQSLLSRAERIENIKDAFQLGQASHEIFNKHILLFDDVITTGQTIKEACTILQQAQPASIRILTAAKSI